MACLGMGCMGKEGAEAVVLPIRRESRRSAVPAPQRCPLIRQTSTGLFIIPHTSCLRQGGLWCLQLHEVRMLILQSRQDSLSPESAAQTAGSQFWLEWLQRHHPADRSWQGKRPF